MRWHHGVGRVDRDIAGLADLSPGPLLWARWHGGSRRRLCAAVIVQEQMTAAPCAPGAVTGPRHMGWQTVQRGARCIRDGGKGQLRRRIEVEEITWRVRVDGVEGRVQRSVCGLDRLAGAYAGMAQVSELLWPVVVSRCGSGGGAANAGGRRLGWQGRQSGWQSNPAAQVCRRDARTHAVTETRCTR